MTDKFISDADMFKRLYYNVYMGNNQYNLYNAVKGNRDIIQRMKLLRKLPVHNGCVNTISWNETGELILSGSDDQRLCITNGYTHKLLTTIQTSHRANIFSAKFLPNTNNQKVISCSGDGIIMFTNVSYSEESVGNSFDCHFGTAYKIVTVPNDPHTFLSCGEDGTVRWYDLRIKQSCHLEECREDILINSRRAVTALAVNPLSPYQLAVGCSDSHVQLFDRRMMGTRATGGVLPNSGMPVVRFTVPGFENRAHRITSLVYSAKADEMLVSYSSEYLYLFRLKNIEQPEGQLLSRDYDQGRKTTPGPLPMKRLRLRGDWSDTGPNARPEREMQESTLRPSLHTSLMQRMSDVLIRMLNNPGRNQNPTAQRTGGNSTIPQDVVEAENVVEVDRPISSASPFTDSEESHGSRFSETSHIAGADPVVVITKVERDETSADHCTSEFSAREDQLNFDNTGSVEGVISHPVEHQQLEPMNKCSDHQNSNNSCNPTAVTASINEPLPCSSQDVATEKISPNQLPLCETATSTSSQANSHQKQSILPTTSCEDSLDSTTENLQEPGTQASSVPGKEVLQNSLHSLEKELLSRRKNFIERHRMEPVINLHYSPQGVSSGIISMGLNHNDGQLEQSMEPPTMEASTFQPSGEVKGLAESKIDESADSSMASTSSQTDENVLHPITSTMEIKSDTEQELETTSLEQEMVSTGEEEIDDCSQKSAQMVVLEQHSKEQKKQSSHTCSLAKHEKSSVSSEHFQQDENENSHSEIANTPSSESSRFHENTSDSSSGEEELTRCWLRRQTLSSSTKSESTGELVRNMEEATSSSHMEECVEADNRIFSSFASPQLLHKYTGHRNARTMIKEANFWGEKYVMSGSDCGHIFFWDRYTGEVVMILEADRHVVNCVQPHPYDPVLASSGIDYDIKLWAPLQEEPNFDEKLATEIIRRNEIMLEETRDTITVPASFMIRMLASLNHLRSGTGLRSSRSELPLDN